MGENKKINWEDIIQLVGKPVFDENSKKWRVIDGYKRIENEYYIFFTDNDFSENYKNCKLYLNEVIK